MSPRRPYRAPGSRFPRPRSSVRSRATRQGLALLLALLVGHATRVTSTFAFAGEETAATFKRGAVVTVDARAAAAGTAALERGGTAADATVAAALVLAVVHPQAGNLAGGHFTLWRSAGGRAEVIDAREIAPAAAHRDMFLDAAGQAIPGASTRAPLCIGVPGTVPGLALLHARHGRLPWADLVAPAERLARDGFNVSPRLALDTAEHASRLAADPDAAAIYLRPDGSPLREGEILRLPDLAESLRLLRVEGPAAFQEGSVAVALAADLSRRGARLVAEDLRAYRPVLRHPLVARYAGHKVLLPPLPSAGGIAVAQALGALSGSGIEPARMTEGAYFHLLAEILRRTAVDRYLHLADPGFADVPLARLLDRRRLEEWIRTIDPAQATPSATLLPPSPAARPLATAEPWAVIEGQTTHLSVVDRWRNAVAHTTTLNSFFGAAAVARGTGILWNDEMDDFASAPGVPNSYGLPGSTVNTVEPGKRPLSSMTPTVGSRGGRLAFVLGSPGGPTIPSAVLQVMGGLLDLGRAPQEAVDAPRIHHQAFPDRLEHEPLPEATLEDLRAMGHETRPRQRPLGDVHLIAVTPGGRLHAAADPRRGGAARGH